MMKHIRAGDCLALVFFGAIAINHAALAALGACFYAILRPSLKK